MEINLNDKQQEAVEYINGPLLILAGAGSGKTSVITRRISHMIKNENIDPFSILAITFTNKAASEMKSRVSNELQNFSNNVLICTFHSLCVRILRQNISLLGYTSNFTIYDSDDSLSLVKRILKNKNFSQNQFNPKAIRNKISNFKNQMINPQEFLTSYSSGYNDKIFYKIYAEYENELTKSNALDFDDLLIKTVLLFEQNPQILLKYQERFKYIMIDEYQDTNLVQFKIVNMLASKYKNICVVGDDDQSIYRFRGADITNILNFENHFPNAKQIKLEKNYRSTIQILNCANHLILHNSSRKDKKMYTDRTDGEKAFLFRANSAYEEADIIQNIINDNVLNDRKYKDITILYRSSYQSRLIEEKLLYANIPYKIIGGINFYSRKEIKDIISYLRLLDNPNDNTSLLRIINTPKRRIGPSAISTLSSYAEDNDISLFNALSKTDDIYNISRSKPKLDAFYDFLCKSQKYYKNHTKAIDIIDYILEATGYLNLLKEEKTDESYSRIENIQELRNKAIDSDLNLSDFLEEVSLISDADNINQSENYVKLMTIHASKGLEFPVVIICGLEDGVFPSIQTLVSCNKQDIEEERRVLYVAITRAIDKLYFTSSKSRMINGELSYNELSTFIKEIPEDLIENACDIEQPKYLKNNLNTLTSHKAFTFNPYNPNKKVSPIKMERPNSYDINEFKGGKKIDPKQKLEYTIGDRVSHIKYGLGTISNITDGARDYTITVDFDDGNTRNLLAAFSKLKKVE